MSYKELNRRVYDENAAEFDCRTRDYLREYISDDAELFLASLNGRRILDLGSGSGRDSLFFKDRGFNPVCVDFSSAMIDLCRAKGLRAVIMDLENLTFANNSFDAVWAYTSLLHIPKINLNAVLNKINDILKDSGIFYMGMKEGNFEGWIKSDKYTGQRFFALYSDEELRRAVGVNFDIFHTSRVELGNAVFLNYLCRRK